MHHPTDFPAIAAVDNSAPLTPLLEKISHKYFLEHAKLSIQWGIPTTVSITRIITHTTRALSPDEQTQLARAQHLLEAKALVQAAILLQPLADTGDLTAQHLLMHTLKRLHDNRWESYAAQMAMRHQTIQLVPASSYTATDNNITLHHYLRHRKAPRFVLVYLIFHECAQARYASLDNTPSEKLLQAERNAPRREKAQQWLKQHGFPVFCLGQNTHPPSLWHAAAIAPTGQ